MRHYQRVSVSLIMRRVAGAAVLFWLVVTLIFALVRLAPGDPATLLVPPSATAEDVQRLQADLGLDRPVAVQYARWAGGLLRGNLGDSFALNVPVTRALADAAPISMALGLASILLTFAIGVPAGNIASPNRSDSPRRPSTARSSSRSRAKRPPRATCSPTTSNRSAANRSARRPVRFGIAVARLV